MIVDNQFNKEELMMIIQRFIMPFLSIENDVSDNEIIYSELQEPIKKRFIDYDIESKEMNFYPSDINSTFKLSIKCEFNKKIRIIRDIMSYVLSKKEIYDPRFIKSYFDFLVEEGFVNWLALRKDETAETLMFVLSAFKKWTNQTFEGHKKSFVIGINLENEEALGLNIKDIIENHYFATITEAYNSAIVVNKKGIIIDYVSDIIPNTLQNKIDYILPTKCESIIKQLHKAGSEIILSLEETGDLLIYKVDYKKTEKEKRRQRTNPQMKIVLAYRSGQWLNYDPVNFKNAIHGSISDKNIPNLLSGILDVSLEHSGGSISILDASRNETDLQSVLSDIDNLRKTYSYNVKMTSKEQKRLLIEKLLIENGNQANFFTMDRHKRLELLSMDGATIIDKNGDIIAVGAIINGVEPSEDGGARTASVKKLSQFGIAIKISTDGGISVYKNNKIKFKM